MLYVGHDLVGSWAICAFAMLGFTVGLSGYAVVTDASGQSLAAFHERALPAS